MPTRSRPHAAAALRLPETHSARLPNGLETVVAQRSRLPLAVARLELWTGSAEDPQGREGLADFTGQLLRRGTRRRAAAAIDAAIEQVGGGLGVDVDQDSTSLVVSLPAEHLNAALDVLAELATQAAFAAPEVALARRRTLASLVNELDDPSSVADLLTSRELLGEHPYAHAVGGRAKSVKTFTRPLVLQHYGRSFQPARAHLFVVGAVDPTQVLRRAARAFGSWKPGRATAPRVDAPLPDTGRRVIIVDKPDATQTQLRLARVGLARRDPRYLGSAVTASILGGGFTSRLMEELRVRRGLTYGVNARFYAYRAGGEFVISTFTANENVGRCLRETLRVCRELASKGPTSEELRRTATYLSGLYPLQLETNEQIARMLGDLALHGIPRDEVTTFSERVHAVGRRAVQDVAQAFFPLESYLLVAVGPAQQLRSQLAKFGEVTVLPLARAA